MNGSRVLIGEAGEILGGLGGEHNNPVGAGTSKTTNPVVTGIIDTEKLANSKEFQEMLPYINGKPKTK